MKRFNRFELNPRTTHHILGGAAAALIGAGGAIGGALISGSAASDAAGTSAAQAAANAAALKAAGERGDKLLSESGATADQRLLEGYQGAVQDMRPYDRLGMQGSNALARYLGFVTEYQGKKPVKPSSSARGAPAKTVAQMMADWKAANYGQSAAEIAKRTPGVKAKFTEKAAAQKAAADKQSKNALAKYKTDLAEYNTNKADYKTRMQNASGRGAYFKPYTQADLMADPVYQTELNENVRAWDQSAASRGSLMSGNTVAGLRELTAAGIERGYNRDWSQRERKFNAYSGLNNMGLGVRTNLANARMSTASQRANTGVQVGTNRANILMEGAGSQAYYNQYGADSRAAGQVAQGNAWGNAFNNIGYLGMKYGSGAFGTPSRPTDPGGQVDTWY